MDILGIMSISQDSELAWTTLYRFPLARYLQLAVAVAIAPIEYLTSGHVSAKGPNVLKNFYVLHYQIIMGSSICNGF